MKNAKSLALWLYILFISPSIYQISAQTVSIAKDAALLQQSDCVLVCMAGSGAGLGHGNIVGARIFQLEHMLLPQRPSLHRVELSLQLLDNRLQHLLRRGRL
jgi:hypothetical protein